VTSCLGPWRSSYVSLGTDSGSLYLSLPPSLPPSLSLSLSLSLPLLSSRYPTSSYVLLPALSHPSPPHVNPHTTNPPTRPVFHLYVALPQPRASLLCAAVYVCFIPGCISRLGETLHARQRSRARGREVATVHQHTRR